MNPMNPINFKKHLSCLRLLAVLALLLPAGRTLSAQRLLWETDFAFRFDNREYAGMDIEPSRTNFGIVLSPRIGLGWGNGHALYAGADIDKYFGKNHPSYEADILFYYQFDSPHFSANAGLFPWKRLKGEYPKAFFDDSLFFDTSIEGTLLQYRDRNTLAEFAADWTGCVYRENRERFRLYAYARREFGPFYAAAAFMMHHYAGSEYVAGVVDNIWLYPYAGIDLARYIPLDALDLRAGWLQTFQNDRIQEKGYFNPGGFQAEIRLAWHGVGLYNTLYLGPGLLPYFDSPDAAGNRYGRDLYLGSLFYRTDSGCYNRLEAYWEPRIDERMTLRISSVHHFDGRNWGWQQLITLLVNLNGDNLSRPGKTGRIQ